MKILFFCGSLEPGRDGVGDYTRRLAAACAARGHTCTVIALHDPAAGRMIDLSDDAVRLIRLPAGEPWPDRLATARQHLERLAPDWVSWQLVAQGFHPRGFLPSDLLQAAAGLRGTRCHVMLHELWLGLEVGSGWRAGTIGWLQQRSVLCLLDQLDPDCVSTSNPAYQQALAREGFAAGVLGLFGNVPVAPDLPERNRLLGRWLSDGGAWPLVVVTFGTLHPQWQPAATADWLNATAWRLHRRPVLLALGRTGFHAAAILDRLAREGVAVGVTGELDETTVSHLLQAADLGLAPHPWALIGKSGAAAAMLDHGLPVLVPRDDWQLRGNGAPNAASATDPLLERLNGLDDARTDRWLATRRPPAPALPRVTTEFLFTLEQSASRP